MLSCHFWHGQNTDCNPFILASTSDQDIATHLKLIIETMQFIASDQYDSVQESQHALQYDQERHYFGDHGSRHHNGI